jgi:tRNA/tmRNA/rRNA uracil-C5-methylase (TrmA/RlmC/RlmD family)
MANRESGIAGEPIYVMMDKVTSCHWEHVSDREEFEEKCRELRSQINHSGGEQFPIDLLQHKRQEDLRIFALI